MGRGSGRGWGVWQRGLGEGEGAGDISSNLPYTALPHGASPQRNFAQSSLRTPGRIQSLALLPLK